MGVVLRRVGLGLGQFYPNLIQLIYAYIVKCRIEFKSRNEWYFWHGHFLINDMVASVLYRIQKKDDTNHWELYCSNWKEVYTSLVFV